MSPSEFSSLIEQLGAASIEDRKAAELRLMKLGAAASPALTQALDHRNPEVAARAKTILKEISRKPIRGFPASDLNFQEFYGSRESEPDSVYFVVGIGIFAPRTQNVAGAIQEWMQSHSRARAVPVLAFDGFSMKERDKKAKWWYVWIEDDSESLNLFLVERGFIAGDSLKSPFDEILVAAKEYEEFLDRGRVAQRKARVASLGIWNPEIPMSMAVKDPWEVRAEACLFEKAYAEAIKEFKQGLDTVWKDRVLISIARCHDKLGEYAETLDAYDQVLKVGLFEEAVLGRAHAMSRREGADKADEWLIQLKKDHPNDEDADLNRGTFHMEEKRYGQAIEIFKRRLDVVLREEKITFDDQGNLKIEYADAKGRERWKNYYPLDPLLGKLAECHFLSGDLKSAIRCSTMGITAGQAKQRGQADYDPAQMEAGDAGCRLVRARVWLATGKIAEAKADLAAAKVLAPLTLNPLQELRAVEAAIKDFETKKPAK